MSVPPRGVVPTGPVPAPLVPPLVPPGPLASAPAPVLAPITPSELVLSDVPPILPGGSETAVPVAGTSSTLGARDVRRIGYALGGLLALALAVVVTRKVRARRAAAERPAESVPEPEEALL